MKFSAIHTLTLLDYPDTVAAIVFTPGCNFRCHYCHNAEFVLPEYIRKIQDDFIPEEKILGFLEKRKGKLEGLVISGGEPTLHGENLLAFMQKVKDKGFRIKLDTNGTHPEIIEKALRQNLLDFVAMDIKAPSKDYRELTGVEIDFSQIKRSRDLLDDFGLDYELRTTIIQPFHTPERLQEIFKFCAGAPLYTLQNYRPDKVLNPAWKKYTGFAPDQLQEFVDQARKYIKNVRVFENL